MAVRDVKSKTQFASPGEDVPTPVVPYKQARPGEDPSPAAAPGSHALMDYPHGVRLQTQSNGWLHCLPVDIWSRLGRLCIIRGKAWTSDLWPPVEAPRTTILKRHGSVTLSWHFFHVQRDDPWPTNMRRRPHSAALPKHQASKTPVETGGKSIRRQGEYGE